MKNILIFIALLISQEALADDLFQLTLERAARIVASSYFTGNPNENLYGHDSEYYPKYPKDIIHKNVKIRIDIEHSISDKAIVTDYIQGFEEYSDWLTSVRKSDSHSTLLKVRTLGSCSSNCCYYPFTMGILHNRLYLTRACFAIKDGKPYLESLYLLDGD